jgi:hypothetical protein
LREGAKAEEGGGVGVFGVLGADRDGSEKLCKPRKKISVHSRVNHVAKREGRRTEPKPTPATPTRLPMLRTPAPLPFPARTALSICKIRGRWQECQLRREGRIGGGRKAHISISGGNRSGEGDGRGRRTSAEGGPSK